MALGLDGRPKVRKRAQEAIASFLGHPPPGPTLDHPVAELCATWTLNNLRSSVEAVDGARKHKHRGSDSDQAVLIHALQLTRAIATASRGWPSKSIEPLSELLLSISRSRNEFLVLNAFEVFETIVGGMSDETSSSKLKRLLDSITELKPTQNDLQLIPSWIAILSRGYELAAQIEPEDTFAKLPELIELISIYLTSPTHNIRVSASECLISFFANCVPGTVVLEPSIYDEKVLENIGNKANELLDIKYQLAWMEVFSSLSALFDALRWRGDPFLLPLVQAVGELRGNDGFQGKQQADEVLGSAIRNLGPQAILAILPHGLVKPNQGQAGRAWLLPLLRDHVTNTSLSHFKTDMVPLSEAMYERVMSAGKSKTVETKIFETVVQQIWATFPGYCDLPLDLENAFDQPFAEFVSNLLYKHAELRVDLCRGLQNLVESNRAILASDFADEDLELERRTAKPQAERNIQHLTQFASNLLAVLFNVYSQTMPQSRAHILQCINAYLSITPEKDLVETFTRVSKIFESSLPRTDAGEKPEMKQAEPADNLPPTSHTLLDLIVALSIYLPRSSFGQLFALASTLLSSPPLAKSEPQLLKKAYKIIPRLATTEKGSEALRERTSQLQKLVLSTGDKTPVPARRDRLLAINTIISFLPLSDLHFIPSILPEVVLGCKDSNKNARNAAFDLLIDITSKIGDPSNPPGTLIHNRLVSHMPDDAPDVEAKLEEVFTMVSAGLAGVAPHMVAASITALARLLFEYSDRLENEFRREIVDTVSIFLQSNNREIVRAVLGFVKVVIVLPSQGTDQEEHLRKNMKEMTPALMVWSKENKGRMRVKVRDILDRCIRRFGAEEVEQWADGDERKMIANIRKRRERSKRKKKDGKDDDEEGDAQMKGERQFDNEFDEAIYGSDENDDDDTSEINGGRDDDDEGMVDVSFRKDLPGNAKSGKQKSRPGGQQANQFIRHDEDDDEPLDLLDPKAQANITSKKMVRFSSGSTHQQKGKSRTNEDGKLVFGKASRDDANEDADGDISMGDGGAVDAYVDAVSGPDAVQRGQRGRLKVKSAGVRRPESRPTMARPGDGLSADEAKEVSRQLNDGADRRKKGVKPQQNRRGLGVDKRKGPSAGRIGKRVHFKPQGRHGGYNHGHGKRR